MLYPFNKGEGSGKKYSSLVFTVFEDISVFLSFPLNSHVSYSLFSFFVFRYIFLAVAGHSVKNGFLD